MADKTKIEWARHPVTGNGASWNPILAQRNDGSGKLGYHCEHVSRGCKHCYAELFNMRKLPNRGTGLMFKPGHRADVDIIVDDKTLMQPLRWKAPRGIFVCSMTDLFGEFVPDSHIDRVFAVMALAPQHVFYVLTKRPERMREYIGEDRRDDGHFAWPLPNVWLGTSAENQECFDERWPQLRETPAAKRFLSLEPMLGRIDMCEELGMWWNQTIDQWILTDDVVRPDWVIVGGESGPGAEHMDPRWARSIRDQCKAAAVPFFFKQWGAWVWAPEGLDFIEAPYWAQVNRITSCFSGHQNYFEQFADGRTAFRVSKEKAGRLLDGVEHNEMPKIGGDE